MFQARKEWTKGEKVSTSVLRVLGPDEVPRLSVFFFFLRFNDSVRQRRQDTGELKYNLPILFRGSDYRGRCFSLAVF